MFVGCVLFVVYWCALLVVSCVSVGGWWLFVVCCLLIELCGLVFVVGWLLVVGLWFNCALRDGLLFIVCCGLWVDWWLLCGMD